jgi:hypothetical protein
MKQKWIKADKVPQDPPADEGEKKDKKKEKPPMMCSYIGPETLVDGSQTQLKSIVEAIASDPLKSKDATIKALGEGKAGEKALKELEKRKWVKNVNNTGYSIQKLDGFETKALAGKAEAVLTTDMIEKKSWSSKPNIRIGDNFKSPNRKSKFKF